MKNDIFFARLLQKGVFLSSFDEKWHFLCQVASKGCIFKQFWWKMAFFVARLLQKCVFVPSSFDEKWHFCARLLQKGVFLSSFDEKWHFFCQVASKGCIFKQFWWKIAFLGPGGFKRVLGSFDEKMHSLLPSGLKKAHF